ncbi:MAG TPA: DUF1223 domain-containing protein [Acetobacteraceae bacterium]|nr:DUF1223 domain-containing protein [Acetobacteraceae bacterium]
MCSGIGKMLDMVEVRMLRRTFFAGIGAAAMLRDGPRKAADAADAQIVLELFTSQGCSSCPPADALLGELVRLPNVVALAWHVDYWNGLGWRDRYASPQFTRRQRDYPKALREEVYTPALVINGSLMVVGSDRAVVRAAMRQAPQTQVAVPLERNGDRLMADFAAVPPAASLLLVFYDLEVSTQVGGGENTGRHLREFQVVRQAAPLVAGQAGVRVLSPRIPAGQGAALLVQDPAGRIIGAAALAA